MDSEMSDNRFVVVLSSGSRSGQKVSHEICRLLGDKAESITLATRPEEQSRAIREARAKGIGNIWVGGGDGTIRAAASELAGTKTVLSILPLGTGNALARELEIPVKLEEAIDFHLNEGVVRRIDCGAINGSSFVNVATLGFTTKIMEEVQESNKGVFGRLVYVPSVVRAYTQIHPFHIRVETEGECFVGKALQFVAASTRLHGGPFPVSEHAAIDDGKLSVYVLEEKNRASLIRYCAALALGKQTQLPEVWSIETTKAVVTLPKQRKFVVDGDPFRTKIANISIQPGALYVSARPKPETT